MNKILISIKKGTENKAVTTCWLRMRVIIEISEETELVLIIPEIEIEQFADIYYFSIDVGFMDGDESTRKALLNVINLLKTWVSKLEKINHNELVFLPFDFSDQYIGCLKIKCVDESKIEVSYGYTTAYMGVSIWPSQCSEFTLKEEDFVLKKGFFVTSREVVIQEIKQSIKKIDLMKNIENN